MTDIINVIYVGDKDFLKDKTALAKINGSFEIKVQFDDLKGLPPDLTHGWTPFPASQFVERHNCDGKHEPEVRANPEKFRPFINPKFKHLYDANGNSIEPLPKMQARQDAKP